MSKGNSLALALSMKRKAKKKMADGGSIDSLASSQKRPMPDDVHGDSHEVGRSRGKKALQDSDWDSEVTIEQAQRPSSTKLSTPKEVGSDALADRLRGMKDEESDMNGLSRDGYNQRPMKMYDAENKRKSGNGPDVSDMSNEHSTGKKPYDKAVERDNTERKSSDRMVDEKSRSKYARGGSVDMEPEDSGMEKIERDDEGDMVDRLSTGKHGEQPKSSYDQSDKEDFTRMSVTEAIMARKRAESEANHNSLNMMADGGEVSVPGQEDYADLDIIKKIMMKRKMMADGGQVDLNLNSMEQPNKYYPRNEDEVLKENYASDMEDVSQPMDSNEHGDDLEDADEDNRSLISAIRKKMKKNPMR